MNRTKIAALTIGLTLAAASPVLATPAQARQIHALKATIAKDHKVIKADNATIRSLRARPPVTGPPVPFVVNPDAITSLTVAQAWALVPILYSVFPVDPTTNWCGTDYLARRSTWGVTNPDGSALAATDYTFSRTIWSGMPGCTS